MFGEIEIRINAAHPNLPLAPLAAFAGSPSTVRVLGVPGAVGRSRISQVSLVVVRPDNSIRSVPCVFTDGVWTGSLAAFDESVRIVNGFRVVADGIDENGNEVSGYVLGVGDIEILALDGTVTPGKTIYYLHFVSEIPESPNYADVAKFGDGIRMWDGAAWQPFTETSDFALQTEVLTVAAGDTLQPSTIGRFTAVDSSEVGFTLADPPAGKMAEYEVWVDCKSAAPAAVSFRLADPAKVIDPRVEGSVRVMAVGKTYIYRIQAFENPDANHVSFTVFQQLAKGLSKVADLDWLYAPNTAMEIDTSKRANKTFTLNIVAIGEPRSVTVYWGDGTETTADCRTDRRTTFSHAYARSGTYVVQVSDVDVNIQSSTQSCIVRACRWGDSITNGWATFQDCKNLVGPVPRWGKSMESGQSAFQGCTALTGTIPEWGEKMTKCSGAFMSCSKLTGIWNTGATEEEIMPSRMVEHSGVVTGCSSTVRGYFKTTWGGTKTA